MTSYDAFTITPYFYCKIYWEQTIKRCLQVKYASKDSHFVKVCDDKVYLKKHLTINTLNFAK